MVLLTHQTWLDHFGGRTDVVGTTVRSGVGYRIAGVLPVDFVWPSPALTEKVHIVVLEPNEFDEHRDPRVLSVAPLARLRPDVSLAQAQAEVDILYGQIGTPETVRTRAPRVIVQPLQRGLYFLHSRALWVVIVTGGLVLLAAWVNLVTLLTARARVAERARAIRVALGASSSHLFRTALLESALICGAGAGLAVLVCLWTQPVLLAVVPPMFRGFAASPIDTRLLWLSCGLTSLVALMATFACGVRARRDDAAGILGGHVRGADRRLRGGATLLAAQAGFGVVLVAAAVMTVGSYAALVTNDDGWTPEHLYRLDVSHGGEGPGGRNKVRVLRVVEVVSSVPGVIAAGTANRRPFDSYGLIVEQWRALGHEGGAWGVSAGLFPAMGMSVRAGRVFSPAEVDRKELVAVLNETAVRRLWPSDDPAEAIGRQIRTLDGPRVIVGVVGDMRRYPGEVPVAAMFLPLTADEMWMSQSTVEVLVRLEPGGRLDRALVKARLDEAFDREGLPPPASVESLLAPWFERPRFLAAVLGGFAVIALSLSALGVFALSSFDAARRRREMAVRLTLGATRGHLGRLIVGSAIRPVVAGSALGMFVTWWAARLVEGLVVGVDVRDIRVQVAVSILMVVVSAAAAWLPARRAAGADPSSLLRTS